MSALTSVLKKLGIAAETVIYNPSYDDLFNFETSQDLAENERARVTNLGAAAVDTGVYTGRSAQDKYIVKDALTENTVWWQDEGSDNKPLDQTAWQHLKSLSCQQLNGKKLYVIDGFAGTHKATQLKVRLVTEVAWMAHFFKNMFIRPSTEALEDFEPDWTILNACKTACDDFAKYGLRSKTYIAFNITEKMTVIGNTWYGGEIKKGIFSMMNYFLPLQGVGSFHCSANQGTRGDTALFFGLSGTGKTTLSADPERQLIGDDEHGWDKQGIFNIEGGCYAKTINLSAEDEPEIYAAIRRDALLENVVLREDNSIDFTDDSKTQNTRVSYPIHFIDNALVPSEGTHPQRIIFLTCDAYGVLPPVSCLTHEQALYQFLSGYTAKVAGTELGVKEPSAVFSACFGQPFLTVHPTQYAEILSQKMKAHGSKAYLVNTGWTGGAYGIGKRISISDTRAIIHSILSGDIDDTEQNILPLFDLRFPSALPGVNSAILNPRNTWADTHAYDEALKMLANAFVKNFKIFTNRPLGASLESIGPVISKVSV